ncbi:hypothetical protein O6H91_Y038300 [Diphasiastrum complanatum]|nr:hypothetical protein O6H91_Y038300 [Diphasiastrum complanatum]
MAAAGTVCVTGASGFIASWLVKLLLERGYVVRATVRDVAKYEKTAHLRQLPGANERLQLFEAELLVEGSFDVIVKGCDGVFHTASPVFNRNVTDPQAQLIDPAVKGTINILRACANATSVKKVVVTSSAAAVVYNRLSKVGVVVDETWFSDPDFLTEVQNWYALSKTLAEQAAWKFAKENGINMVTIHPAMVIGALLQPTLNASAEVILQLVKGSIETYPNASLGWVGVKDTAEAHILAYEEPTTSGRYLCLGRIFHYGDIANILKNIYLDYPIPIKYNDESSPRVPVYQASNERLQKLGLKFQQVEELLVETIGSLKEHKFL